MPLINRLLPSLVVAAVLFAGQPVFAQKTGPNGGMLVSKDNHETELVVGPTGLTVYLIEEGKVQPVKGVSLRAVIQSGGKNSTVDLTGDTNKLVGKLPAPLAKGAIVVITGKDDHGHAVNARYVIN